MPGLRILVIDDDVEFLVLLGKNIESWGHKTILISDGEKALEIIKNKEVDMVVLDYLMPKMDGVQTLENIRRIDKLLPAIMFTSFPDSRSIVGTKKLGIFAYVPKVGVFTDPQSSLKTAIAMIEKNQEEK